MLLFIISFNVYCQSTKPVRPANITVEELKNNWKTNGADDLEGIYTGSYNCAIIKYNNGYIYLQLDPYTKNFAGECYGYFTATGIPNIYQISYHIGEEIVFNDFYTFEHGKLIVKTSAGKVFEMIKIFPTINDKLNKSQNTKRESSGTGFAISSNGIIVTNYHVIEGANSIQVKGINAEFSKSYKAKVIVSDKHNDLALIQIDDKSFTTLGIIPYIVKTSISSVGENIFVMGYPLRASMGDEIKLTNGIISSKTGYQGDISSYQISAPVQPGNSGAPLFNSQGNLIGIVNAKLIGAENASYAIKTNYLTNLFELLPIPPKLQTTNLLTGKYLTSQVETIKNFVYIIEINYN